MSEQDEAGTEGTEADQIGGSQETNDNSDQNDEISGQEEEVTTSQTDNESVQKAINKQHRKFREEERKNQELRTELQQAKDKLAEFENKNEDVSIPDTPDAWDDDYSVKMKARDEAIRQNAVSEQSKQTASDNAYKTEQSLIADRQKEVRQNVVDFTARATKQGIKEDDLITASNRVADARVSPEFANFLLTDDDGPLITAYLADEKNTVELFELANMGPVLVGMKITELKKKAQTMKQKGTSTPPPADDINGRGAPKTDDRPMIANAKFD